MRNRAIFRSMRYGGGGVDDVNEDDANKTAKQEKRKMKIRLV